MCQADRRPFVALLGVLVTALCSSGRLQARQQVQPPPEQREKMLGDCRYEVLSDVKGSGRDRGFGSDAEVVLAEDGVVFVQEKKDRIKIEGTGEFRYGPDYLMAPMTFSCEWDTSKNWVRKGSFKIAKGADPTALPPHKAVAVEACKREVEKVFKEEVRRRDYYSPSIRMQPGIRFQEEERGVALFGVMAYKLDSVQTQESEREFRCLWDPEAGRALNAETRVTDRWRPEVGSVNCESRNMARKTCRAPVAGDVRVRSNHSDTRCSEGTNWSYSPSSHEIVVWDGCRATFEFDMR